MNYSGEFLTASEAAERLGVSTKALRLYEQRGLVTPSRTAAGYRANCDVSCLAGGSSEDRQLYSSSVMIGGC
jgi:predicted site-specific integrase-resolvase